MSIRTLHEIQKSALPSHIVVTTQENYPYSGVESVNGTLVGTGYAFIILNLLAKYFNFTYEIKLPEGDDSFEEVVGLLQNQKVDVAVAFMPLFPELRMNCTYGAVLDESELTFFMRRPPDSASGSGLFAPFDVSVWILIIATVFIVGPLIYICVTVRAKLLKDHPSERYSFNTCMWFVYGALLKQGSTVTPVSHSIRLLFATWWVFNIILTAFYTANLTAFLTLSQFTLPINSIKSLVEKKMNWFSFKGKVIDYMINKNYTITSELRDSPYGSRLKYSKDIVNYEVLNKIDETNAVFITENVYAQINLYKYYIRKMSLDLREEERCKYVIMPNHIFKVSRAFAYANKSSISRQFNKLMRKLIEGGLVKYLKSKDLPEATICPLNLGSKERNLRLMDLSVTYSIVLGGLAIAIAIFIGELIYVRCNKKVTPKDVAKRPRFAKVPKPQCLHGNWMTPNAETTVNYENKNDDYIPTIKVSPVSPMNAKIKNVNGREYYVVEVSKNNVRLIPIRNPSAIMFQRYRDLKK